MLEVAEKVLDPAHVAFYKYVDLNGKERAHLGMQKLIGSARPPVRQYMEELDSDDLIGHGTEKSVYPYGPNLVAAFIKDQSVTTERVKAEFYTRKLAAALLPGLIPNIHLAGTKPPVLILDRVHGTPIANPHLEITTEAIRSATTLRFYDAGIDIDATYFNFVIGTNGAAVYTDSPRVKESNVPKIEIAIAQMPDPDRSRASRYLERFVAQDQFVV